MRTALESVRFVVLARDRAIEIESRLADLGCHVLRIARSEAEAEHAVRSGRPDVVVLEGGTTGDGFLERARREDPSCAFLVWLPSASSDSAADAFEVGADEVVHEGMGKRELGARLEAAARRNRLRPSRPLELGALRIDDLNGEAEWGRQDLELTRRERQVLHALAESAGATVRRELLYKRVWGYAMARGDRAVDVNVKRLRAKLAKHAGNALEIKTQPGVGYRLELAAEREHDDAVTAL
jgi:DNA-binding response OmpR family regulator